MTAERAVRVERHADGHTVTVVVVCGFIGCDWSMAIGTAPLEAHQAYIDHLDVHDPDHIADCEATEPPQSFQCPRCQMVSHHPEDARQGYCGRCHDFTGCTCWHHIGKLSCPVHPAGLYAGDTPEQIAAEQARVNRFMAGGNDA